MISALIIVGAFVCSEARQVLANLKASELSVGPRAVFAGLLAETGQRAAAFQIGEKISDLAILPEENWFLARAFR